MDNKKVIRSAGAVGFFVLVSRVFGLVRDVLLARVFGTSLAMSAFVVAFTIPNLFRSLFGEGAMSSAFVPVFVETRAREGDAGIWPFAGRMFATLSWLLFAFVFVGILIVVAFQYLIPGGERLALILSLLRIMLPYMFFICLTAFFSAMLNSLHQFRLPAFVPVVLNLTLIVVLAGICPLLPESGYSRIKVVAWSVLVGGLIQALMQLPRLYRHGFRLTFIPDLNHSGVQRVLRLMGVAIIGVGVTQLNVLLDRFIAAFISQGSPSYLYFAERLIYFPLGIFATALGTVLLPAFSGQAAQSQKDQLLETLERSIKHLMFMMIPAAAGIMALAAPIVQVVYERGDFTPDSTRMTMLALMFYAPGLIVFGMLKVLVPLFYAHQDMRTPVRVGLICTALNIGLSLVLMWPLKHLGIALATVLAAAVHVVLLVIIARRRIGIPPLMRFVAPLFKIAIAVSLMVCAALFSHQWLAESAAPYGGIFFQRIIALIGSMAFATIVYIVAAFILRCSEIREIFDAITMRRDDKS